MLFPDSAKHAISEAFYDKEVAVLSREVALDDQGGVIASEAVAKSTFKANVRFAALEKVREQFGIVEKIDIAITCSPQTGIAGTDLLSYADKQYSVVDMLRFDSHLLIVGKRWR